MSPSHPRLSQCGALWGVLGILAILCFAIFRLAPYALVALSSGLTAVQWLILVAWCAFMIASEGRDGFEKRIAPRIISRAQNIKQNGDIASVILAPLYCFGYFRASKRQLIVSYSVILLIIGAVILVHQLSQPWRGIIDCGVILGLSYGVITITLQFIKSGLYKTSISR